MGYHPYLVSMLFADLLSLHRYIFKWFLFLFMSLFSRCMPELKFAIYHRAASLSSQVVCSIGWSITCSLQVCPAHQLSISNSTILRNDYISLLSDLCACVHVKKQVWYFISKNQPGLGCTYPLKSSPGSHSLLLSDSVGITSSCSLLASPLSVSLVSSRLRCLCFSVSILNS